MAMSTPLHLPAFLAEAPVAARTEFAGAASRFRLPAGRQLLLLGQRCTGMSFLETGCVRVYLVGTDGREITLYRVRPDEACVLTAASILGGTTFPAAAIVEADCAGWLVPEAVFRGWVDRERYWRQLVFQLLARRLGAVLARLEERAFHRLDARLAACLLARAGHAPVRVAVTHQALADELASAREAVSRVLERWTRAGWVRPGRGAVTLRAVEALRRTAGLG
jgi:CRP/FNR family transcriptional regulator